MCDNGHPHAHHYPAGEQAGGGPVVLDIGVDRGALIVYLDASRIGTELYLRPLEHGGPTTHTGVWERPLGSRRPVAAVFPSVPAGAYAILGDDGGEWHRVAVGNGAVTEASLIGARRTAKLDA